MSPPRKKKPTPEPNLNSLDLPAIPAVPGLNDISSMVQADIQARQVMAEAKIRQILERYNCELQAEMTIAKTGIRSRCLIVACPPKL